MPFSAEILANMKEAELQSEVLIPLFRAMGFRDVTPHQGASELGKDLVMWKPGDLGERVNYAVVAKAKRISGKAKGSSSSAANVRFQIEQAFNSPYVDPVTAEEQHIDRCWVVSSKQIGPTAVRAIEGVLRGNHLDKVTRFIDGNTLWNLIERHLGERTVLDKLAQVQAMFEEANPYHRIVSTIRGNAISFSLEPKDQQLALEHPVSISTHLKFPDTEEGRAKREELERFLDTGSDLTISKEYIERVELPEFLQGFIEPVANAGWQVALAAAPTDEPFLAKMIVKCPDGDGATLDCVHLVKTRGGRKQATLSNQSQRVPWQFEITVDFEKVLYHFKLGLDPGGANVKRVLEGVLFLKAMSKGGLFVLEHLDTGFLMEQTIEPRPLRPSDGWIETIKKLVFIQNKTRVPLVYPARTIEVGELKVIWLVAQRLAGQPVVLPLESWGMNVEAEYALELLKEYGDGQPRPFQNTAQETATILDTVVPPRTCRFGL
jgi:hypothetical protein